MKVPRHLQQFALMVGIILALIFRGIFIALGAAAIDRFSWVFFLFGAFLIYTAVKLVIDYRNHDEHDDEAPDNPALRFVKKRFPSTDDYHGTKLTVSRERQAADHADADRDRRARQHRPAVRAGLDPGHLRADPGAVPGLHRQRLRADGPAPAVLPDRRPAASGWSTCRSACRSSWPSSASS